MKQDVTAEQKARDMLKRMGVEDAQEFSAGEVVELANLIANYEMLTMKAEVVATVKINFEEPLKTNIVVRKVVRREDGETIVFRLSSSGEWLLKIGDLPYPAECHLPVVVYDNFSPMAMVDEDVDSHFSWNKFKLEIERQLIALGKDGSIEIAWVDTSGPLPEARVDEEGELIIY